MKPYAAENTAKLAKNAQTLLRFRFQDLSQEVYSECMLDIHTLLAHNASEKV